MIASVFFNSWIGAFLMAIASARLFMVYKDRFTLRWMVFFLVLSVILGFAINTLGFIGLNPIVAVAQITICNYAYKNIRWIKLSLIVNEAFYIFYFYLVFDLVSTVVQVITVAVGCVSMSVWLNPQILTWKVRRLNLTWFKLIWVRNIFKVNYCICQFVSY